MTPAAKDAITITLAVGTLLLVFAGIQAFAEELPPGCDDPVKPSIVYTRMPRADKPFPIPPAAPVIEEAANWQHVPDVGQPFRTQESDVVLDDTRGGITVIHDCTTSPENCAAMEARVSPDGLKIVYVVQRAHSLYPMKAWGGPMTDLLEMNNKRDTPTTAELWLYNIPTGKREQLTSGYNDRTPDWCGNDCLLFVSDRAGVYPPAAYNDAVGGSTYPTKSLQLYKARIVK